VAARKAGQRLTLVVCDDNERVLTTLTQALRARGGHVVVSANSFDELLVALESGRPDVIVLDVNMPGLDGLAGIERLRKLGYDVPIIVMSADERRRQAAEAAGAASFFYKGTTDLSQLLADIDAAAR